MGILCGSIWQLSLAFSQATLPVLFAQLAFAHRPKILTVEFTFEAVDILYHIHAVCNIQISKNAYFVKQRIPKSSLKQIQATNPAKGRFRKQRMAAGNAQPMSLSIEKTRKRWSNHHLLESRPIVPHGFYLWIEKMHYLPIYIIFPVWVGFSLLG